MVTTALERFLLLRWCLVPSRRFHPAWRCLPPFLFLRPASHPISVPGSGIRYGDNHAAVFRNIDFEFSRVIRDGSLDFPGLRYSHRRWPVLGINDGPGNRFFFFFTDERHSCNADQKCCYEFEFSHKTDLRNVDLVMKWLLKFFIFRP
jgi:hypothetical protein